MNPHRWLSVLWLSVLALALGSCATPLTVPDVPEVTRDLTPRLPLEGVTGISIHCHTATVRVDAGSEVVLLGTVRARGVSRSEAQARCDAGNLFVERTEDGFLEIRSVVGPSCPLVAIDFSLVLTAPADMPVRILIDEGHVAVRSRSGPLVVRSGSASVSARLSGGSASIESVSGDVSVQGTAEGLQLVTQKGSVTASFGPGETLPGQLSFRSTEGSLRLDLQSDAGLAFEHTTKRGRLISEFPVEWLVRADGVFSGTIGSRPAARLTAVTEIGDVEIRMASSSPSANLGLAARP
jgi:hypothetical protein